MICFSDCLGLGFLDRGSHRKVEREKVRQMVCFVALCPWGGRTEWRREKLSWWADEEQTAPQPSFAAAWPGLLLLFNLWCGGGRLFQMPRVRHRWSSKNDGQTRIVTENNLSLLQ